MSEGECGRRGLCPGGRTPDRHAELVTDVPFVIASTHSRSTSGPSKHSHNKGVGFFGRYRCTYLPASTVHTILPIPSGLAGRLARAGLLFIHLWTNNSLAHKNKT